MTEKEINLEQIDASLMLKEPKGVYVKYNNKRTYGTLMSLYPTFVVIQFSGGGELRCKKYEVFLKLNEDKDEQKTD